MASDDEDDYMNMTFEEPAKPKYENSLQRAQRIKKEKAARAVQKTKAELKAEDDAAREAALETHIPSTNKGFKMLSKLGYTPGSALGKSTENARTEPINITLKENRGGIGADAEKKRKFKEEWEAEAKRVKVDEDDFVERRRQEMKEREVTGKLRDAQKTAERIEEDDEVKVREAEEDGDGASSTPRPAKPKVQQKPLRSINVLWRGLAKHRLERDRDAKARRDFNDSLGARQRLPRFEDPDEDADDKLAYGRDTEVPDLNDDLDEVDPELEEFEALPVAERLEKIVLYLREKRHYCFWCKYRYPDATMDGCPGITEEDHD